MALPGLDLRDGVQGLVGLARRDLATLWRQVSTAAESEMALRDILPSLIDTYGIAAGTLAADWYDDAREKAGVGGSFTAIPADTEDPGTHALIGWALAEATDYAAFQSLVEGGMQRRITDFSRGTVMNSSVSDPRATGWQRTGSGECKSGFCDMLIGRGSVYRTEESATFASHDWCKCSAVPAWGGQPIPVKPFKPSARQATDADRARVRAWIADNL